MNLPELINDVIDAVTPGPDLFNHETQEEFEAHKKMVAAMARENKEEKAT